MARIPLAGISLVKMGMRHLLGLLPLLVVALGAGIRAVRVSLVVVAVAGVTLVTLVALVCRDRETMGGMERLDLVVAVAAPGR